MPQSKILDIHGNPFRLDDLSEPQTESESRLAQLHRHYADHPSSGLTPRKLAGIMREAEQGNLIRQCELAEDMEEKDAHIQSELGKRRLAWQGPDWNIKPPPAASAAEKRDAELIEELLRGAVWLDDAIFDAGDAILKSFACQELQWEFIEGLQVISNVEYRDPSWFKTHPDRRNELRLRDGSYEGAEFRPFGWLNHFARAKSGYLARRGLVRVLAWPFLFKNYSVRDLAEFLEIYGLPLRLGKYPEGASEREKLTLLRAVMSIGHNAGGIIPKGMEIEFEKAADGASDPFMAMISWCEKSQSKAILGGTLTSQADGKSSTNALGNVHNEVRQEIRDADLKALANTLTRDVVYPLYALNGKSYRNPRRIPRFEFDLSEPEDLKEFTAPLKDLVELGLQVPVSWVQEKTHIPAPVEGEAVLTLKSAKANEPSTPEAKPEEVAALKAQTSNTLDNADLQAAQLREQAGELLASMTDQVRQLVEGADSLEAIRDGLLDLEPEISPDAMGELLAKALAASELLGALEVEEGR